MCNQRVLLSALVLAIGMNAGQLCYCASDLQLEGFHYIKEKNFQKALDCFDAALKEHPASWAIMQSIGNSHMELGHYSTAIVYLQKSIEAGGLHAIQCNNMSAVYQRLGDAKKALSWLQLACSLDASMQLDPLVRANIRRLQNPANNPKGPIKSSDYLSSLISSKPWPQKAMPLSVFIRQNFQLPSFYPSFSLMVRDSLDQWCKATDNRVSYRIVRDLGSADLVFDYTDRPELVRSDHELGAAAVTEFRIRMQDNRADRANTVILIKESPEASMLRDRAFLSRCCLHEVGHALAMDGHSPNPNDVMFPIATSNGIAKLSQRDKNTIWRIYQR